MNRTLNDRERILLGLFRVTDNVARYTGTDHVPDWAVVKKVFNTLGATWKPKPTFGFVFPDDVVAEDVLNAAMMTGTILDPKLAGFFETPVALAAELVAMAKVQAGDRCLEPSAGRGRIAFAIRDALTFADGKPALAGNLQPVMCVELLDANVKHLRQFGFDVIAGDFLAMRKGYADERIDATLFDAIVMNPPFAGQADVHHISHAHKFLRPGGRLVSVASAGVMDRQDKKAKAFRAWVKSLDGKITKLPDGSFKTSGTMVRTCVVRIGC